MVFNIACIGAGALGLLLGYVFAWSTRRPEPNGTEVASLVSTVLGGTVLQLLNQIDCQDRLAIYIIGVAVGYALYLIVLQRSWTRVDHFIQHHGMRRAPLAPWTLWRNQDPCCCGHKDTTDQSTCK